MSERVTVLVPARPSRSRKRLKSGVKEYTTYRITIPQEAVQQLGLEGGLTLLIATFQKPKWYHLFNWDDPEVARELLPRLTERERLGLCATLAPETVCRDLKPHILLARPEELRKLGLDPEKPLTLQDLVEKIKENIMREEPD